jgi:raffinose/stachyose/melibiose transport system permease protein
VSLALPRSGRLKAPASRGNRRGNVQTPSGWGFLAPVLAINVLVIIGPCIATIVYSFTNWTGYGPIHFIGFGNYASLLHSQAFGQALVHNLEWTVAFLIVPVLLGLVAAFAVSQIRWGQRIFRTIFFLPYIISPVVNAALWAEIYAGHFGIAALRNVAPLGNPTLALWAVALANIWAWWGFLAVVFLSAMQGIPRERYEVAELDGAGAFRQARYVTIPGIRPTLVFMLLMTIIWSMLVFNYIYIMTGGGPAGATQVVATLLYQDAFQSQQVGLAASMGVVLLAIAGAVGGAYVLLSRRTKDESV